MKQIFKKNLILLDHKLNCLLITQNGYFQKLLKIQMLILIKRLQKVFLNLFKILIKINLINSKKTKIHLLIYYLNLIIKKI